MSKLKSKYDLAKKAKVGDTCTCPSCNTEFIKENYQQVFCKTKGGTVCKDKYWNTVTPTKRNNTTRISPANQDWQDSKAQKLGYPDHETMKRDSALDDNDGSWDAHGCNAANCDFCGLKGEYCQCGEGAEY